MGGDGRMSCETPTRRDTIKYGGTLAAGSALAGCSDLLGSGSRTDTATPSRSYTVTMSPMGEVRFDAMPESIFTVFSQYVDMAVALGRGDAVNAMYVPEMAGTLLNHYCHHLDGVSFEWDGLFDPLHDGFSKEQLFEFDSDVHLADPVWAATRQNWDQSDVDEVTESIGPWFGNHYSGTNAPAPDGSDYEHYTLWELFEKVAAVFRQTDRYEKLAAVHSDLVDTIQSDLPPASERPTAVRVSVAGDSQSFYTYHLNRPGYWLADTRPLGANDAFAERDWDSLWGEVGFEAMAAADPDVILHLWGMTPSRSMADTRNELETDPVGQTLSAVRNDRVYAQGMRYQGPIMNLFQIEMTAKQLYPDLFGEWPRYRDGEHYPAIPEDERLFDRQRVANIVTGEV